MKAATYIHLLRPSQWLKNLMLFFPPFLGGALLLPDVPGKVIAPFIAFCTTSSATYILNDIADRHRDREHPVKQSRPIASGAVPVTTAVCVSLVLLILSFSLAQTVSYFFVLYLLLYLIVSVAYTLWFKNYPVVDIFSISFLFIVRLMAGGEAFNIIVSEWLFLSVFLLALFLSTGKRLSEKMMLGERASSHREALDKYPDGFLPGIMYMTGSTVLVTYTMYVLSRHMQIYTVPLCAFGLLRYLLRVMRGGNGDPTESLLHDLPLLLTGLAWGVMVGWGIYGQ